MARRHLRISRRPFEIGLTVLGLGRKRSPVAGAIVAHDPALGNIDDIEVLDPHLRPVYGSGLRAPAGCRLFLRGWAALVVPPSHALASEVVVTIGARRNVRLRTGRFRRDIGLHLRDPAFADAGFQGTVALDGLGEGSYPIALYAVGADGRTLHPTAFSRSIEVVASNALFPTSARLPDKALRIVIDSIATISRSGPAMQTRFRPDDVVVVRGHAFDPVANAPAVTVFSVVDDGHYVRGVVGLPSTRADVPAKCGFTIRMTTENLSRGYHAFRIAAFSPLSEGYVLSEAFRFGISRRA